MTSVGGVESIEVGNAVIVRSSASENDGVGDVFRQGDAYSYWLNIESIENVAWEAVLDYLFSKVHNNSFFLASFNSLDIGSWGSVCIRGIFSPK